MPHSWAMIDCESEEWCANDQQLHSARFAEARLFGRWYLRARMAAALSSVPAAAGTTGLLLYPCAEKAVTFNEVFLISENLPFIQL